jgi:hypothetical protein
MGKPFNLTGLPMPIFMPDALEAHSSYKRGSKLENDTRSRSVFGRPDDQTREIVITVIVVPIPKAI